MIPATGPTNTRLLPIHEDPTSSPPASAAEPSPLPSYCIRGHSPTIMDCSSDLEEVTPLPISLNNPMIIDGPDITQSRDEIVFKHMKALREQPGVVKYYVHKLQEHGIDPHKHEAWFPATVTDDSSADIKVRCRLCGPQATYTLQHWQQHLVIKKHVNRVAKRTEIEKKVRWEGFQKCDRCATGATLEGTKDIKHSKDCAWNYNHDEEPPITETPAKSPSKMLTPAELEWAKERARLNKWKAAKAARAAKVVETPPVPSSSSKDASKSNGSTTLIDAYPSPVSPHREARVPRVLTPSETQPVTNPSSPAVQKSFLHYKPPVSTSSSAPKSSTDTKTCTPATPSPEQARDQPIPNLPSRAVQTSFRNYKPPVSASPPTAKPSADTTTCTPPATLSSETQALDQSVSNPPTPSAAQTNIEHTTPSVPVSPTPGSSTYHNTCAPVIPPLSTQTRVQPASSSPSLVQASHKRKAPSPPVSPPTVPSHETQARVDPVSSSSSPSARASLKRKAPPAPLSLSLKDSSGSYSVYAPPTVSPPDTQAHVQPIFNSSSSPSPAQASRKRKAPPAPLSLPSTGSSVYQSAHSPDAMPHTRVQHISSLPPSPTTPGFQHQRTPPIPVSPPMVDPNAYHRAYVFMPSPESQAHVQLVTRSNRPPPAIPTGFQYHQTHPIPLSTTTRVSNAYHRVVYGPGVPEPPCPQVPLCFQPYLVPRENLPRLRVPLGFRASSGYPSSVSHSQVYADGFVPVMSRKRGFDDSSHYEVSQ